MGSGRHKPVESRSRFSAKEEISGFRLERLLRVEDLGEVWRAVDLQNEDLPVDLKILSVGTVPGGTGSFEREVLLAAFLRHPNIVQVHGLRDLPDHSTGLSMEVVDGLSVGGIRAVLWDWKVPFPPIAVVDILLGTLRALSHAWEASGPDGTPLHIVHRNLNPEVLRVTQAGHLKVEDFGMAKTEGDDITTAVGALRGRVAYMAPERMHGDRNYRPTTDLFAVGVIAWELIVGKPFYARGSIVKVMRTLKERTAAEEAAQIEAICPPLAPVIANLLKRKPIERTQRARDAVEALEAARGQLVQDGSLAKLVALCEGLSERTPQPDAIAAKRDRPWAALEDAALLTELATESGSWAESGSPNTTDWSVMSGESPSGLDASGRPGTSTVDWSTSSAQLGPASSLGTAGDGPGQSGSGGAPKRARASGAMPRQARASGAIRAAVPQGAGASGAIKKRRRKKLAAAAPAPSATQANKTPLVLAVVIAVALLAAAVAWVVLK